MALWNQTSVRSRAAQHRTRVPGCLGLLAVLLLVGSCASQRALMPTPDLYALGISEPYPESLPAALKTTDANIIYLTDRAAVDSKEDRAAYGMDFKG